MTDRVRQCRSCGAWVKSDAAFCTACGAALEAPGDAPVRGHTIVHTPPRSGVRRTPGPSPAPDAAPAPPPPPASFGSHYLYQPPGAAPYTGYPPQGPAYSGQPSPYPPQSPHGEPPANAFQADRPPSPYGAPGFVPPSAYAPPPGTYPMVYQPYPGMQPYGRPGLIQKYPGSHPPGVAVLLSFLLVGAGQMYNGQVAKGILLLLTAIACAVATGGLSVFLTYPLALIDAAAVAGKLNRGEGVHEWQWF